VTAADAASAGGSASAAGDDDAGRMDLPKWNRSRVKRKAPKGEETDAFQDGVRKAGRGAVRRAPLVAAAIALAAGGLGLGIYLTRQSASDSADATQMLATAAAYEARGVVAEPDPDRVRPEPKPTVATDDDLEAKVSSALSDLATTAADTPAHRMSRLLQGGRAMRAADFPAAEAAYRQYLEIKGDDSLNFLAREGMVLAIEAQGRLDDALSELEPLMAGDERGFFRDQALWHKGRILEAKSDAEGALATYREYAEHFPLDTDSFARDSIVERMTELDPEFTPPPKPEAGGAAPGLPFPLR